MDLGFYMLARRFKLLGMGSESQSVATGLGTLSAHCRMRKMRERKVIHLHVRYTNYLYTYNAVVAINY